jgi:hypothetical protein
MYSTLCKIPFYHPLLSLVPETWYSPVLSFDFHTDQPGKAVSSAAAVRGKFLYVTIDYTSFFAASKAFS